MSRTTVPPGDGSDGPEVPGGAAGALTPRSSDELVIGVVIDLPEPVAGELAGARREYGDAEGAGIHPHITLRPPQLLPAARRLEARDHLQRVAAGTDPFRLELCGSGSFRPRSPVVYVRVGGDLAPLQRLQQRTCRGPLAEELAYPFHPHVTVAHGVPEPDLDRAAEALADYRATVVVDAFAFYVRTADGTWRRSRRIALGGAAPQETGTDDEGPPTGGGGRETW